MVKLTSLNIAVLAEVFGSETSVKNALKATDIPHMRRCMSDGCVTATKETLTLTDRGVDVVREHNARVR